jgi:hypothetical protein
VLPGTASEVPPGLDITQAILVPAVAAMQTAPAGALAVGLIEQTPVPFASPAELVQSIATALAWHAMASGDLLEHTHGHPYFDNSQTEYAGALSVMGLAAVNEGVERFSGSPSALEYLDQNYEPTGDLRIPMLMLSTSRDPVVPGFHQRAYREAVAATGNPDLLVQRTIDRYGHCVFDPAELAAAFADLVRWAELGIKPAQ